MEFLVKDASLWRAVERVCRCMQDAGGRAHLVGGCVRDAQLGSAIENFDIEVFGLPADRVRSELGELYAIDLVGEAFGVLKVRDYSIDVSLPRRESKAGLGHRGFEILSDPDLSVEEAAARRDFTINAMAWDPLRERLLDPFGGADDLEARRLRHTSEQFSDDPLRVLRGMQIVARFDLVPHPGTVELCRGIDPEGLAPERVFEEWRKLLVRGRTPSRGLEFLRATGWVRYYPELAALIDCPQDPEWHPEGDVWIHTLHVLDAFALELVDDEWEDLVVGLACLCHDFGKPATTVEDGGRWRSRGHEDAGEAPTRSFLSRMSRQEKLVTEVVPLVVHHLKPRQLYEARSGDAAVRRLARKVGRIDRLLRVARSDDRGRPPRPFDGFPAGRWLEERAYELEVAAQAPQPLVMGRHLVDRGLEPGPGFGPLLEDCFGAQLDGRFSTLEGGLEYLDRLLDRSPTVK